MKRESFFATAARWRAGSWSPRSSAVANSPSAKAHAASNHVSTSLPAPARPWNCAAAANVGTMPIK